MQKQHARKVRTFALVRAVARLMGRERRPELDGVGSSLYPFINRDHPYWVTANDTLWATTEDRDDAIAFASRLASTLQNYERVTVTMVGLTIWSGAGTAEAPAGRGW